MNTCPPELHAYICRLACKDNGHTMRALSLVSSYFGEVARRFALQSVSVTGWKQVNELAVRLRRRSPQLEPVRDLHISTPDLGSPPENTTSDAFSNTIMQVMSLAAPTLETLSLDLGRSPPSIPLLSKLYRLEYPALRELSISGFYPFPSTSDTFPSLTHLHLTGNRNPHGLFSTGGLKSAWPSLACLRVSGLSLATTFLQELEYAIYQNDSDDSDLIPPPLQTIILQAVPPPPVTSKATSTVLKDAAMMRKLDTLCDAHIHGVSVRILERGTVDSASLENWWLDRMNGKDGSW